MGARQAFEGDIDAAGALRAAGGGRATRAGPRGCCGGMVEATLAQWQASMAVRRCYWRQLGALSLIDSTRDGLAADHERQTSPRMMRRRRCCWAVSSLRAARSMAEAAFRRQIRLSSGSGRWRRPLSRPHHARPCVSQRAGQSRRLSTPIERRSARCWRCSMAMPRTPHCSATSPYPRPDRRRAACQGRPPRRRWTACAAACRSPSPWPSAIRAIAGWQHDLSVSLDRVGEALSRVGDLEAAHHCYLRGLAIAERLVGRPAGRLEWHVGPFG